MKKILKHLAGQHNQKRHGSRYSSMSQIKRSLTALQGDEIAKARYRREWDLRKRKLQPELPGLETPKKPLEAYMKGQADTRTYRQFTTYAENEELKDYYNLNLYDMDSHCAKYPQTCSSLNYYTGSYARPINEALRNDAIEGLWGDEKTAVGLIDAAFENFPKVPEDMKVFRGAGRTGKRLYDELNVGDSFIDKAFVSTSTDESIVDDFNKHTGTLFEIRLKKGQQGIFLKGISAYANEDEMLLPRNKSYKVLDKKDNRLVLEMQD